MPVCVVKVVVVVVAVVVVNFVNIVDVCCVPYLTYASSHTYVQRPSRRTKNTRPAMLGACNSTHSRRRCRGAFTLLRFVLELDLRNNQHSVQRASEISEIVRACVLRSPNQTHTRTHQQSDRHDQRATILDSLVR